jgi:hypothetical protein
MTASELDPAAIRVVVNRPSADTPGEEARLEAAGLTIVDAESGPSRRWATWRPATGDALVTIDHELANEDLACAYFTGECRLDLAVQIGSSLNYVPVEVMHLSARSSPVAEERRAALHALGQFYSTEDDASCWDGDISETLALAEHDHDPDVRLEALMAEMKARPAAAVDHLRAELGAETDKSRRERLDALVSIAERAAERAPAAVSYRPGSCHLPDGPLAIPFFIDGSADDFARRFDGIAEVVARRSIADESEMIELRTVELDATITYAASRAAPVGCLYFAGEDRVVAATGTAPAISYFPMHLAKLAAQFASSAEVCSLGLLALAFASSKRMDPDIDIDPAVPGILAAALRDDDPAVRSMAAGVQWLLTGEVGRG